MPFLDHLMESIVVISLSLDCFLIYKSHVCTGKFALLMMSYIKLSLWCCTRYYHVLHFELFCMDNMENIKYNTAAPHSDIYCLCFRGW